MATDGTFASVTGKGWIGLGAGSDFEAGGVGEASAREFFGAAACVLLLEFGAGDERRFVFNRAVAFGDCLGVAGFVAALEDFGEFFGDDDVERLVFFRRAGHGWCISFSAFAMASARLAGDKCAMGLT